jgi:hypothetical protein
MKRDDSSLPESPLITNPFINLRTETQSTITSASKARNPPLDALENRGSAGRRARVAFVQIKKD